MEWGKFNNHNTMEHRSINANGININCLSSGEIEKMDNRRMCHTRTSGSKTFKGYRIVGIGGHTFLVHRLIARAFLSDYSEGLQVDHIDGDRSNNRLRNLRMATNQQNMRGRVKKRKGKSSEYRGVYWNLVSEKWHAQITIDGKRKHIGYFLFEGEAALAYNASAIENGFLAEALNQV